MDSMGLGRAAPTGHLRDTPPDDEDNPPPEVPLPQPLVSTSGGITVHTAETALLAELLSRYGATSSFVRDSTWTLVLPRAGAPPGFGTVDRAPPHKQPIPPAGLDPADTAGLRL